MTQLNTSEAEQYYEKLRLASIDNVKKTFEDLGYAQPEPEDWNAIMLGINAGIIETAKATAPGWHVERRVCYVMTWDAHRKKDEHVNNIVKQVPSDQLKIQVFDGENIFTPDADGAASYSWLMNNSICWVEERIVYDPEPAEEWEMADVSELGEFMDPDQIIPFHERMEEIRRLLDEGRTK